MLVYGENVTIYDYSQYYDESELFAPCNSVDVRDFGKVFLPTLYSLVFILGFIGNGLVVCVLVKYRHQTNLTDICLFNLALSDLLFVITLPFYANYAVVSQWLFGDFMCHLAAASHTTGFFSSIFFMVLMTLDCYVVIMHAHTVVQYRTLRAGVALTVLVWMLSFSVSLPAIVFTKVTNESHGQSCDFVPENDAWKLYNLFTTNLLGLVIPLLVMVVSYSRIIPTLVNMRSTKKHRVVKLIISIVVVFFLFWAPYNISLFLGFLKDEEKLQGDPCTLDSNLKLAVTVTEAFAYTHCCLNPIIYAFVGQKFMKRALRLLKSWVPGIYFPSSRDLSDSSYRKSSFMSRSSEVTSTIIK
ncbi:C-C chemokine receptor type 1 isoform X4 [Dicentrarchus labrax]|uniref:C-C chemokine receptor type 1 isoform X3 n=1 Tax=Dicentrarchus labrax TaxID=13489 RepID=UPI0021F51278|nr:C-C chemokine receptor type 1 isoform X3 [Dicentrarchus labrax]XP_051262887.1 C-C chemokine receptor type 1 isoform X4 [Dicentrarchus labrax]